MTTEHIIALLVLLYLIYQIQKRIKVLGEGEAFAVLTFGRYKDLINSSGLHFKASGSEVTWERINLGQNGIVVGDGMAKFNGFNLPITSNHEIDTPVKIKSFEGKLISVSNHKKSYTCEKCGHENHV